MQETTPKRPSYEELEAENLRLKFEIINLKKVIFGQRRERFIPAVSPEQMIFSEFDALEEVSVKTEQISYTRSKRKRNHTPHARQLLPAHLPRKEIVIEPEEDRRRSHGRAGVQARQVLCQPVYQAQICASGRRRRYNRKPADTAH